ncbi:MAG: insulinase family protein, partial [Deltaproteobacteria bacterium]|nr:insulinase family protein [Deltaproteobacteria bacterium]
LTQALASPSPNRHSIVPESGGDSNLTHIWQCLYQKVPRDYPQSPSPKTVILLSGDFSQSRMQNWASALASSLTAFFTQGNAKADLLPPCDPVLPSDSKTVYVLAGCPTPVFLGEGAVLDMMAVWLAQAVYEELIVTGLAYHTGVQHQPLLSSGLFGLWVETTPGQVEEIQNCLQKLIANLSERVLTPSEWENLWEKTCLHRRIERDATPERDHYDCRDIGIWQCFPNPNTLEGEHRFACSRALLAKKWCFARSRWKFLTSSKR